MRKLNSGKWAVVLVACVIAAPQAGAAMAVIDVGAIRQLVLQIQTLKSQLDQARDAFQAENGSRGMQSLLNLPESERNYLPRNFGALRLQLESAEGRALLSAQSVLPQARLDELPASEREWLIARRQNAALLQLLTREALSRSSARFASLQQLQAAIGSATDPKAIADLTGRIGVENAMLENEQAKLSSLFELARSEEQALSARTRELAIQQHGEFGHRFAPTLP